MTTSHEKSSLNNVSLLKRKDTRINMLHDVTIKTSNSGEVYQGKMTNLSFGGAFIELKEWITAGVEIQMTLQHKGHNVTTEAQIVHQSNNGIGSVILLQRGDIYPAFEVNIRQSEDALIL